MGQPVILLEHGAPRAVLISYAEAQRWLRIERASSVLHGLNIAPEAMRDTARIGEHILNDDRQLTVATIVGITEPHEILEPIRTTGISDARERFAEILEEVYAGRPLTIVHGSQYAVVLISPREYDRLRRLSRPVGWFAGAGLDLAAASDGEIRRFVDAYRARHGVVRRHSNWLPRAISAATGRRAAARSARRASSSRRARRSGGPRGPRRMTTARCPGDTATIRMLLRYAPTDTS